MLALISRMLYSILYMAMTRQEEILKEMASIRLMARGKLCEMGRSKAGRTFYSHQTWRNGRNVTAYVPAAKVERLREATQGYERFMKLVEEYVDIVEAESMK